MQIWNKRGSELQLLQHPAQSPRSTPSPSSAPRLHHLYSLFHLTLQCHPNRWVWACLNLCIGKPCLCTLHWLYCFSFTAATLPSFSSAPLHPTHVIPRSVFSVSHLMENPQKQGFSIFFNPHPLLCFLTLSSVHARLPSSRYLVLLVSVLGERVGIYNHLPFF